jgi:phage major head subunit gpT-like protein
MILDPTNLSALRDSINTRFQAGFRRPTPIWPTLAMLVPSKTSIESYAWTEDVPRFREWVGERAAHDLQGRGAQIVNKKFEGTLKIPREKIEDDQYGLYGNHAELLGVQARKLPDDLIVDLVKGGKTATCFDGQYFFDTDHPVHIESPGLGTWSNLHAAKPIATGTLATDRANFESVRTAMKGIKLGRSARVAGVTPTVLVCGTDLEGPAKRLVVAEKDPSGATNVNAGSCRVLVIPELDETGVWYLLDDTLPVKPFVWQERTSVEWTAKFDPNDDNVFKLDEFLFGGRMRGNAGYGLPFLIARAEPT